MFIILKLSKQYYHIKCDEASLFLSIFNIPFGRFRFTKMPFGFTASGDAFQCGLDAIICNLDFYIGIADDIITWDEQSHGSDHDKHLTEFLSDMRIHNLEVNINKFQY